MNNGQSGHLFRFRNKQISLSPIACRSSRRQISNYLTDKPPKQYLRMACSIVVSEKLFNYMSMNYDDSVD